MLLIFGLHIIDHIFDPLFLLYPFFFLLSIQLHFFTNVELIHSVILDSGIQHSDSVSLYIMLTTKCNCQSITIQRYYNITNYTSAFPFLLPYTHLLHTALHDPPTPTTQSCASAWKQFTLFFSHTTISYSVAGMEVYSSWHPLTNILDPRLVLDYQSSTLQAEFLLCNKSEMMQYLLEISL